MKLDLREVEPGLYSVLLPDGRSLLARVMPGSAVEIDGRRYESNSTERTGATVRHGHQTLKASMPGKVVRVLVVEGEEVTAGQGLVVVEAMKMQNEMKASRPGRVCRVHTADGATVAAGDVLVTIE